MSPQLRRSLVVPVLVGAILALATTGHRPASAQASLCPITPPVDPLPNFDSTNAVGTGVVGGHPVKIEQITSSIWRVRVDTPECGNSPVFMSFNQQAVICSRVAVTFGSRSDDPAVLGRSGFPNLFITFEGHDGVKMVPSVFNYVVSGDGDDIIAPASGQTSTVCAYSGPGNDTIVSGPGLDVLSAGSGGDTVSGGKGDDQIFGGPDDDVIRGEDDHDTIRDFGGDNTIFGDMNGCGEELLGGNDTIETGAGFDTIDGCGGVDNISAGDGDDVVFGGDGNDTIDGGNGGDALHGDSGFPGSPTSGRDTIDGSDGDDVINGNKGDDNINAGSGDDLVFGDEGDDSIGGWYGDDELFGDSDIPDSPGGGRDTILGSFGNDIIHGEGGDDYSLVGGGGDDIVTGGPGNDELFGDQGSGAPGLDTLNGNDGDDLMWACDYLADTEVLGGAGIDTFWINPGVDTNLDIEAGEPVFTCTSGG